MGQDKKILSGYSPFNEFFYCTCFYSSLAPVIMKSNKSLCRVFGKAQYYYILENEEISVKYVLARPLNEVLEDMGIHMME